MDNKNDQILEEKLTNSEVEERQKSACAQEQFYSIALFDILGFSNFVEKNGNQIILDLYNKLVELIHEHDQTNGDPTKAVPANLTEDWTGGMYVAGVHGYVRVCHFSDTFLIYVNYLVRAPGFWLATQYNEPYPLLLGESGTAFCPAIIYEHPSYLSFLQTCMDFFCQATISGIPLRGCVSSGFATMDSVKSIYFGKPLVEAAKGEPVRKSLGISFGRSFNNYHPVYNEYFIPFWDCIKSDDPRSRFISPMILDWPRRWRESPEFKKYSFIECIDKMNIDPAFSKYYENAIRIFNFSAEHKNWAQEINREGLGDIIDYYQRTKDWYESL